MPHAPLEYWQAKKLTGSMPAALDLTAYICGRTKSRHPISDHQLVVEVGGGGGFNNLAIFLKHSYRDVK